MKFFCINKEGTNEITMELLRKSAKERKLDFEVINIDEFDVTKKYIDKNEKAILYRVFSGSNARKVELKLLKQGNFTTFYESDKRAFCSFLDAPFQEFSNLPIPKTVNFIPSDKQLLKKAIEYVGGFPVIIKATGLSHGAGVMRVDSWESLISLSSFLRNSGAKLMIREYIDSHRHARFVVLGDKVLDSIEYTVPEDDFRTNAGKPQVHGMTFPSEFEDIAVQAVSSIELEFGGVDILIDKNDKPYLAEVNFPCYFPRNQLTTGADISGMMLDYLIKKSKKK